MICITIASRIILRLWKTVKAPEIKEWASAMVEMALNESMLRRVNSVKEEGVSLWDEFWIHITVKDQNE